MLALVALTLSSAASAATFLGGGSIFADDSYADAAVLRGGDQAIYTYTAAEDLVVTILGVTATGSLSGADISNLMFGVGAATTKFLASEITVSGSQSNGQTFVPFNTFLSAGDAFQFLFSLPSAVKPVSVGVSFSTTAPAPIPLPATGVLLLGALGAGLVFRRKGSASV